MSTSSRFAVAVHILTLMAASGDEQLKSERVARSVKTNPVVIRRILCELAKAKLVTSQPGSNGGSRLARKPTEVTLLDVYHALGPSNVFSWPRQEPNRNCPIGANIEMALGQVFTQVNSAVEHVLATMTIQDVARTLRTESRSHSGGQLHRSIRPKR